MLERYENFMREKIKEETGKDVDFMLFDELYEIFVSVGLLEKYPYLETVKELIKDEKVSDKGKGVILNTLYLQVTTPVSLG